MPNGIILVTGASSGVGRACVVRLARLGFRVLAGVRDAVAAEKLKALGPSIEPVILDVTDPAGIRRLSESLAGEALAGLVSNAGISTIGPLELIPLEAWRRQFEVNVLGTVAVIQAFLPHLRKGKGRIVIMGSVAGRSALPGTGAYDSSKFALEGLADSLRPELQTFGIGVSIVEPGAVATAIWDKALKEIDDFKRSAVPELLELYADLIASVRDETAKAAVRALPADVVAKSVEHAITSSRPKSRYVVGSDAQFWLMLNLLPDRWKDKLILRGMKI